MGFGAVAFHVPVRGSWIELAILCVLASLSFSAIGLLVSSRAQPIEAVSGLMNLVMMPMWIVSGVFFSAQRFPDMLQPLIKAPPADGRHRCVAREHAARRGVCAGGAAVGHVGGVADRLLYASLEAVPVAVAAQNWTSKASVRSLSNT